jgi:hypothetical protein
MSTLVIRRVKNETVHTAPLITFIKGLGVNYEIKMYEIDEGNARVFINANMIFHILSSDIKGFQKKAEQVTHFLIINKEVYVNKYGLMMLIADSREKIAFRLLDYIFEVIYKLETQGVVKIDEVESRNYLKEIEMYKVLDEYNEEHTRKLADELEEIRGELIYTKQKYNEAADNCDMLEEELNKVSKERDVLEESAKTLAKYVKASSKSIPVEAYIVEDDDDEDIQQPIATLRKEAMRAKKLIKKPIVVPTEKPFYATYYIVYNPSVTNDDHYEWFIVNYLPNDGPFVLKNVKYNTYEEYSEAWKLHGVEDPCRKIIYHSKVDLSETMIKNISYLFQLKYLSEEEAEYILSMFIVV